MGTIAKGSGWSWLPGEGTNRVQSDLFLLIQMLNWAMPILDVCRFP